MNLNLIVLDIMLPGEDGLSITKRLNNNEKFPVIMLSACGEDVDRIIGLEVGADDYLTKPCEIDELVAKVEGAWEKKDDAQQKDIQDKIHKAVESPRSVLEVFPKDKRKK